MLLRPKITYNVDYHNEKWTQKNKIEMLHEYTVSSKLSTLVVLVSCSTELPRSFQGLSVVVTQAGLRNIQSSCLKGSGSKFSGLFLFVCLFSFCSPSCSIWKFLGLGVQLELQLSLCHSHGKTKSELHLWPLSQLVATLDP